MRPVVVKKVREKRVRVPPPPRVLNTHESKCTRAYAFVSTLGSKCQTQIWGRQCRLAKDSLRVAQQRDSTKEKPKKASAGREGTNGVPESDEKRDWYRSVSSALGKGQGVVEKSSRESTDKRTRSVTREKKRETSNDNTSAADTARRSQYSEEEGVGFSVLKVQLKRQASSDGYLPTRTNSRRDAKRRARKTRGSREADTE